MIKINKLDCIKLKTFYIAKDSVTREKGQAIGSREKIWNIYFIICKEHEQLSRNETIPLKMSKESQTIVSQMINTIHLWKNLSIFIKRTETQKKMSITPQLTEVLFT